MKSIPPVTEIQDLHMLVSVPGKSFLEESREIQILADTPSLFDFENRVKKVLRVASSWRKLPRE